MAINEDKDLLFIFGLTATVSINSLMGRNLGLIYIWTKESNPFNQNTTNTTVEEGCESGFLF